MLEQRDDEVRHQDRREASAGIGEAAAAQPQRRRKQLRAVRVEADRDKIVDRAHQQEAHEGEHLRIGHIRIDQREHDDRDPGTDHRGLARNAVRDHEGEQRPERPARRHQGGEAERGDHRHALFDQECRDPRDHAVDRDVHRDLDQRCHEGPRQELAREQRSHRDVGRGQVLDDADRRQGAVLGGDLRLDRAEGCFRLGRAPLRFEPARRFRHLLAQEPDDHRADTGQKKHRPPRRGRDDEIGRGIGGGQADIDQHAQQSTPAAAIARRNELAERAGRDHQLSAQAEAHDEPASDQGPHIRGEARREGSQPEHREIDLIGIAAAVAVAHPARARGPDQHAEEAGRDEGRAVGEVRKAVLDGGRDHAAGEIDVEGIDETARGDQHQHAPVKARDRKPIEPRA